MIPTFRHLGGKARMRNWLVNEFPKIGRVYCEPFVGKANVFFKSVGALDFQNYWLLDLNIRFLESLVKVDLDDLPETVSKVQFEYWRNSGCDIANVIEPRITFAGKGYFAGFEYVHDSHPPYHKDKYLKYCIPAIELLKLQGVFIQQSDWKELPWDFFGEQDFIYLDPPYHESSGHGSYKNINHEELLTEYLLPAKFKWALSGYETELYRKLLNGCNKFSRNRGSELKQVSTRNKIEVEECLWTNY